jgi:hypothetical protein
MLHFMMGVVFFLVYALLFDAFGLESAIAGWAALFGAIHGLAAGASMGMMPAVHPRMVRARADGDGGVVPAPGFMGTRLGGMAPTAIVMAHVVYGLVAGAVYAALA